MMKYFSAMRSGKMLQGEIKLPLLLLFLVSLLSACSQVNTTAGVQSFSYLEAEKERELAKHNGAHVQVQTPYGTLPLGQILVVDDQYLYTSANGLVNLDKASVPSGTPALEVGGATTSETIGALAVSPVTTLDSTLTSSAVPASITPISAQSSNDLGPIPVGGNPQYVMLAFDGSKSLDMWQKTRVFARGKPVKFTYFVSGVYFIHKGNKSLYDGPGYRKGVSHIGFANSPQDIGQRLDHLRGAANEGHEIGSHANGHFDGSSWSKSQWRDELIRFKSLMEEAYSNNGLSEPADWRSFVGDHIIRGFRAPLLGTNKHLRPVLKEMGYNYDTSYTAPQSYWPQRIAGIYNFPLANVRTSRGKVNTLSMDYNFYVAQSKAKPNLSRAKAFEDEMFETYMNYFNNNYKGGRAPVHIGHHFSLWNGGAYWRAMKRFAEAVCHKPDVRCATYSELATYLDQR